MPHDTVILGGGISGLAVAHYLNSPSLILEAGERPGGLCRSFKKDGFTYDIGGHIMFSKNKEILGEMVSWLGDNVAKRTRLNEIWYKDRYVKYPFENGLSALEKDEIFEIVMTFLNRPEIKPTNLYEWCYARFGTGLSDKYLVPYNEKVWKRDLREMSLHWVERVPSPPMEDIIKSAIGIETEGYTHQLYFHYPKRGGFEAVVQALVKKVGKVRTNFPVRLVEKTKDGWEVSDGAETLSCRRLISTMPVYDLMNCLTGVPKDVQNAVSGLQYNPMLVVLIGIKTEALVGRTALYIADPEILPHRLCFMRNFSDENAPKGCSSLIAEITAPPGGSILSESDDAIVKRVIEQVGPICGFSASVVITTDVQRIPYAYPVYDKNYLENTQAYYTYLDEIGIYFTGRFSAFMYVNSDKCIEMAKGLAEALNAGVAPTRDWAHM